MPVRCRLLQVSVSVDHFRIKNFKLELYFCINFYPRTPDIGFDFATKSGNPFNYFTYGAACSVVEIDTLTGDHEVTFFIFSAGHPLTLSIVFIGEEH